MAKRTANGRCRGSADPVLPPLVGRPTDEVHVEAGEWGVLVGRRSVARARGLRLARLAAEAFGTPAALVDLADAGVVVHAAEGLDADALRDAWDRNSVGSPRAADAACRAVGVRVAGRDAVLAALDPVASAPPGPPPALDLVAALAAEWTREREAISAWLARLEHENRHMARAQRLLGVGTLAYDFAADTLEASAMTLSIFGRDAFETLDDLVLAFDPFDRAFVHRTLAGRHPTIDTFTFEREVERPDGDRRFVRITGELTRADGWPRTLFATVEDVTAEHSRVREIETLAVHDPLTKVYNRTMFDLAVRDAVAAAERERLYAALFVVDLDDFKTVNDTFGHPTGDEILRFTARALTSHVRASDTVLRLAGDEFAVVVAGAANADGIMALAERIHATLSTIVRANGEEVALSATIGVAIFPDDVSPRVDLYKAADQALFEAKEAGRGRIVRFHPSMRERRDAHRAFIASVREGLQSGEFVSHFQPKIDLETGVVVGFEALCRWRHPEHGLIGPAAFGVAFDDREVGGPLADVGLIDGFRAARQFRNRGLPFGHVAVNLNRAQLERPHLLAQVTALEVEFGIEPHEVTFEVLENVLIRERRMVQDNLVAMSQRGYRISLDDFGTGFASLTHLREHFIHEVKIDRSFVSNALVSDHDHQIVEALVQMARKMGLTMVAEGIEDEATLNQLRHLGCTIGQGYVFSAALPFEQAAEFIVRLAGAGAGAAAGSGNGSGSGNGNGNGSGSGGGSGSGSGSGSGNGNGSVAAE